MAFFSDQLGMNKVVNRGVIQQPDEVMPEDKLAAFDFPSNNNNSAFLSSNLKGGRSPLPLDWGTSDQPEDKLTVKPLGKSLGIVDFVSAPLNGTGQPVQLCPIPVWLDTATTILSKVSVAKTLEAVQEALKSLAAAQKVEYTLNSAKSEIEATVISPARASCAVHLYNAKAPQRTFGGKEAPSLPVPSTTEVAVEFRRISGCARAFHAFFHDILDGVDSSSFSRFESHAYSSFQITDLPCVHTSDNSDFDDSVAITTVEMGSFSDTVNTLMNMAKCEYDDAQREALEALVAISTDNANKAKLGQKFKEESGFLDKLLLSSDKEVVALTETILRNIDFFM